MQRKAEFVDSIPTGGITYSYEEYSIFKIVINVTLVEMFAADGAKGDDFCTAMHAHVKEGCRLTWDGAEAELTCRYWPERASTYSATQMTLFYCVPKGAEVSALTFTLDGSTLGVVVFHFSYNP